MIVYDKSCALATGRAILKSTYKLTKMVWNELVQESSLGKSDATCTTIKIKDSPSIFVSPPGSWLWEPCTRGRETK